MNEQLQLKEIFLEAVTKGSACQRRRFLDKVCGDNAQLRGRVESLLAAHLEPESLIDRPAVKFNPPKGGA